MRKRSALCRAGVDLEPAELRGLEHIWIENEDDEARITVLRASEMTAIRQGCGDTMGTLEVLVGGGWQVLARVPDHRELGLMAEALNYLLMTPDAEAGSYRWHGSRMIPPGEPHEWDWEIGTVPFGPVKG